MQYNFQEIVSTLKTKADAIDLVREIDILSSSLFQEKGDKFESSLKNEVRENTARSLREIIEVENVNNSSEKIKDIMRELRQITLDLPIIELTLAIEPSEQIINSVTKWLDVNLDKKVLVNYVYDSSVIGGVQFAYNGLFLDYSVKKQWPELWKQIKQEVFPV